jgi:ATP-binding cassette subfamily B (MDR/TAP) protein 1
LAIARSIIKRPSILILDEATSAIDVRGERIVQAALDQVSRNRTTITIAHRLSTIMKADNIIVMKNGQVIQQGTHEHLLEDKEGAYWGLANAQQLSTGPDLPETKNEMDVVMEDIELGYEANYGADAQTDEKAATPSEEKQKESYFGSFNLFLWEQKHQWMWYSTMILGALGAGAAFPVQSFLFAKLISLFDLYGDFLQNQTNFWCLMFTILAVAVGVSYFALGWSSNTVSFVSAASESMVTATY